MSDLGKISLEEGLYILREALVGYKTIFYFRGGLIISDDMIGFTPEGRVKVWLSTNLAKNTPDNLQERHEENTYHGPGKMDEAGMVSQVIEIVQEHVDPGRFGEFLNGYYQRAPKTFAETMRYLREYMAARKINTIDCVTHRLKGDVNLAGTVVSFGVGGSILPVQERASKPVMLENLAAQEAVGAE